MCKWYENIHGKEKIFHMFDGEFPVENILIEYIDVYDRIINFKFITYIIPSTFPRKWSLKEFNAISFVLTFSDTEYFNIKGNHLFEKKGDLIIDYQHDITNIYFKSSELDISLKCKYIFLKEVRPLNLSNH